MAIWLKDHAGYHNLRDLLDSRDERVLYRLAMASSVLSTMLMTTLVIPTMAVDRYVSTSTSASDANDGSITSPFKTLQACVHVAGAGDACYLRGGTYHEEVFIQGKSDLVIASCC